MFFEQACSCVAHWISKLNIEMAEVKHSYGGKIKGKDVYK